MRRDGSPLPKSITGQWWPDARNLRDVLGAILSWAHTKTGVARVFAEELATNTGLAEATARRCCWALEALGHIERTSVRGWKGAAYVVRIGQEDDPSTAPTQGPAAPPPAAAPAPSTVGVELGPNVEALIERLVAERVERVLAARLEHGTGGTSTAPSDVAEDMAPRDGDVSPPDSSTLNSSYAAHSAAHSDDAHELAAKAFRKHRRLRYHADSRPNAEPGDWRDHVELAARLAEQTGESFEHAIDAVEWAWHREDGHGDGFLERVRHHPKWLGARGDGWLASVEPRARTRLREQRRDEAASAPPPRVAVHEADDAAAARALAAHRASAAAALAMLTGRAA